MEPSPLMSIQKQSAVSAIPLNLRLKNMTDIYYQSQSASNLEDDKVELPPMISLRKQTSAFLSIPLELRLQIYNLCFFQDVQVYSIHTSHTIRDYWTNRDYSNEFRELDLLLVNRQIYHEAVDLAYAAQRRQLIQSHPTYYLSPTLLNPTKPSKKWTWELESQWVWQPSCRSAKALAALRLPKVGLAFRDPYRMGVYATHTPKKNLITEDQAEALKTFFRSLVYHLRRENVAESIYIYLEGHNHDFLKCIFRASEDLQVSRCFTRSRETQCKVIYLSDDLPFVTYGDGIGRNMGGRASIWHWMLAPEEVGRRMPEDMVSAYHLREMRDYLENRGGRWEDWRPGMLSSN